MYQTFIFIGFTIILLLIICILIYFLIKFSKKSLKSSNNQSSDDSSGSTSKSTSNSSSGSSSESTSSSGSTSESTSIPLVVTCKNPLDDPSTQCTAATLLTSASIENPITLINTGTWGTNKFNIPSQFIVSKFVIISTNTDINTIKNMKWNAYLFDSQNNKTNLTNITLVGTNQSEKRKTITLPNKMEEIINVDTMDVVYSFDPLQLPTNTYQIALSIQNPPSQPLLISTEGDNTIYVQVFGNY